MANAKKAKKQSDVISVVTIPLKTERWQEDRLRKVFGMYQQTYNIMLRGQLKKYNAMLRDERYKKSKEYINEVYRMSDEKEKKERKKSEEYKAMTELQKEVLKEYGMSEFSFGKAGTQYRQHFKENLSSACVNYSISKRMWRSFDDLLFGKGNRVKFKRLDDIRSITSDLKSGIRIIDDTGETVFTRTGDEPLFVVFGKGKKRQMTMPLMIDNKNLFQLQMLEKSYRTGSIVREQVKGRDRYYIQISVDAAPAPKIDRKTGAFKHTIGKGHCGVYIDTRKCVVATQNEIITFDLSEGIVSHEAERSALNVYLDASRRKNNPENYNSDGTIKKGIVKDGIRRRLKWNFSAHYKIKKAKLHDLYRKEAIQRKMQRNILCNRILELGDSFSVNDYPFQTAAMRKKETEVTESGRYKSKAKAGKVIGENAPATLVSLLDSKLKANGLPGVDKVKLKDIDYSKPDYREELALTLRG